VPCGSFAFVASAIANERPSLAETAMRTTKFDHDGTSEGATLVMLLTKDSP
jgi:hypothetical protein